MWRPEYGDNPFKEGVIYSHNKMQEQHRVYEAGADAMLEALKEIGIHVDRETTVTNNITPDTFRQFEYGWLVFIPEGEE